MENMVPFFPPPQFAAAQPLPTAAQPLPTTAQPLTTQTPPPLQQPQLVIPPAPLGFMPPPQTNLAELQHITPPQQVVIQPASTPLKQSPNSHNSHPPYAEMIITAIKALNEKTGSSKIAIAKFIDATYTNLPPTHSALLSHHLKRLKDNGLIITIKNSYTLPSLINLNSPLSAPSAAAPASDSTTPKRGRGRPPKTNTTCTPGPSPSPNPDPSPKTTIVGEVQGRSDEVVLPAKRGRGRPPGSIAKPKAISKPKPKPIVVGGGGGGGGGSRGRGRPRKVTSDAFGSGPPAQLAGLVPGMVILPATNENIVVNGVAATTVVSTPPTVVTTAPTVVSTTPTAGSGRPVGRPKKVNVESSTVVPVANGVAVVKPVGSGRSVGRPRKVGSVGRPRKVVGSVGRPKRSAGRPAKFGGGGGGVVKKTAAVSTGRPVGRPRKVGNNIKDQVVTLLEESLGLGMNQSVPDMYLRFTQLYNIITGKDYDIALAGATAQGNNQ